MNFPEYSSNNCWMNLVNIKKNNFNEVYKN